MRHAVILTGMDRYADPWHPFAETSLRLAEIAAGAGLDPEIVTDVDTALAAWRTAAAPDLVIANLGRPGPAPDEGLARSALEGLETMLETAPVLAVHAAANCFPDSPLWEEAIGGRWIPDVSGHPPLGELTVTRAGQVAGIDVPESWQVTDERYLGLRTDPANHVLCTNPDTEGSLAPTIWVRERAGGPRGAYDALGHDARSYESAEHRAVLGDLMQWLIAPRG